MQITLPGNCSVYTDTIWITRSFHCHSFPDERVGNVFCICKDSKSADAVKSHLAAIVRPMYSNPPHHGARIVATILNNPALTAEWYVFIFLYCMMRSSYLKKSEAGNAQV